MGPKLGPKWSVIYTIQVHCLGRDIGSVDYNKIFSGNHEIKQKKILFIYCFSIIGSMNNPTSEIYAFNLKVVIH